MELQRIKFLVSARVKKVERFGLRNYLKPNKNKSGGKKFIHICSLSNFRHMPGHIFLVKKLG